MDIRFEPEFPVRREKLHFERRDWLALLGAAICALAYAFMHASLFSGSFRHLPGIGLTLSCWAVVAMCCFHTGLRKLKWSAQSIFLLTATLLLSASYAIFGNNMMRLLNLPVVITVAVLCVLSLCGGGSLMEAQGLMDGLRRSTKGVLRHLTAPFRASIQSDARKSKAFLAFVLGIAICVPVVGFALLMLGGADAIFGGMLTQMGQAFADMNPAQAIWSLIRAMVITLAIFAFLFSLRDATPAVNQEKQRKFLPAVTVSTVLVALALVYALFVYIQIRFLFAGSEAAILKSGYAEYARSGFFQLVAVGIMNLIVVLPCLCFLPDKRFVRFMCALVSLMTLVIVASALMRMLLYIRAYGLSLLRCVTLWGILAISAAIIATLVKAANPGIRIFRALFIFTICTWLALNYANVSARIVDYNLNAYKTGAIEDLDYSYLVGLGPESLQALDYLIEENKLPCEEMGRVKDIREDVLNNHPAPYDWSLSWINL